MSASTQSQALSALLFLYRNVLDREIEEMDITRAKRAVTLPLVLSRSEVASVLAQMDGTTELMALLMYGAGLRLTECCRLRVKDVDFDRREIVVRDGKGEKDRLTMLPLQLMEPLANQLKKVRKQHERDIDDGSGHVELPYALAKKYPNASREWGWQWDLPRDPALSPSRDRSKTPTPLAPEHTAAGRKARRERLRNRETRIAPHIPTLLRDAPPRGRLRPAHDSEASGHRSLETTMIYCHVLNTGGRGVRSLLDRR